MRKILAGLALAVCSILPSCTSAFISPEKYRALEEEASKRSYIAGFEGLGADGSVRELIDYVRANCDIAGCATAGNPSAHIGLAETACRNGNRVYAYGHSSGGNEARLFAVMCNERGIPVSILSVSDPTYISRPFPGKIPENVGKVVCYRSDAIAEIFGGAVKREHLKSNATGLEVIHIGGEHLGLPQNCMSNLAGEISGD